MTNFKNWIYIAGRGHSGSTLLDVILGNAEEIESVGEFISALRRYNAYCSCGLKFKKCPFWVNVMRDFEKQSGIDWDTAAKKLQNQAHIKKFLKTLFQSPRKKSSKELIYFNNLIANLICKTNNRYIVDSSKEITRALFFIRYISKSKVIHIVRNPQQILQSNYYRLINGEGYKFLRKRYYPKRFLFLFLIVSCFSWLIGNILLELIKLGRKQKFLLIRYEDLIESPIETLDKIEFFLNTSLAPVKEGIYKRVKFQIGHNIGGNKVRTKKELIFDPAKSIRSGLPKRYNLLVYLFCWPLLIKYHYFFK